MIVRNEEAFLSLLSVKNLANEIITSDSLPIRAFHYSIKARLMEAAQATSCAFSLTFTDSLRMASS